MAPQRQRLPGRISWLKVPSTRFDATRHAAPRPHITLPASCAGSRGSVHPSWRRPDQLGSSSQPSELASGRPKVEEFFHFAQPTRRTKKWSISWGWLAFPRACAATSSRSFSTTPGTARARVLNSEFSYYIKTLTARAHMITQSLTGTAAHLSLDYPRDRRRPSKQVIARRAAVSAVQRAQRRRRRPIFCLSVGPSPID